MTSGIGTASILSTAREDNLWSPNEGAETEGLLKRTFPNDSDARRSLASASRDILARCADPVGPKSSEAGLVIGYVQSGKTLSFTTVAALASDNRYSVIILIGGTSLYLLGQTEGRLADDLNLNRNRTWLHILGPRGGGSKANQEKRMAEDRNAIQNAFDEWSEEQYDENDRRTIVLTVMKHAGNLEKLAGLIRDLELPDAPVLIIDDEADQASLDGNAANPRKPNPTRTYEAIMQLRSAVSEQASHTFLQYTATPQANLLIEINDELSPSFVQILHPGPDYIGGRELFVDRPENHLRRIPSGEMDEAIQSGSPPQSLCDALGSFLVGISADYFTGFEKKDGSNRSMLVHPSRLTDDHSQSQEWIELTKSNWLDILKDGDQEEKERLLQQLRERHADLNATIAGFPTFDAIAPYFWKALKRTHVLTLNKGAPPVQWNQHFSFILIGGQALERGFTVEGLTTTHMARSRGQGLADTIQQRARFFGYKRQYLGRLRIWLEDSTRQDFRAYVEHEEDMRKRLEPLADTNAPLREWRRGFLLDPALRATRRNVLGKTVKQKRLSNSWLTLDKPALEGSEIEENRFFVQNIQAEFEFDQDEGHDDRTRDQIHSVSEPIRIDRMLSLLTELRLPNASQRDALYGAMLQVDAFIEKYGKDEPSFIYLMNGGRTRVRSIVSEQVLELYQGRNPKTGVPVYPGDREIKKPANLTLQIHVLNSRDGLYQNVPTFALWIPERFAVGTAVRASD